ncbi:hypothetical protein [Pectobacterium phage Wc4-1]|uniref:Uncharacterized protein n=3 Tax=Arnovirus TaxID=3425109 RepID=A0A5P8D424_9CAUD|nr:hypothetical protein Arno162_133 [Pectobacterium phage Arno162]AZV02320.1 hypothetical protein Arno18_134 [Pectobacterium phage Arno18]QFP93816.1 hypothetical protein [Pectobacterium phage Wc4]QFP93961.1 hypothetical protein [Pectobacterium phage Wc4-1]
MKEIEQIYIVLGVIIFKRKDGKYVSARNMARGMLSKPDWKVEFVSKWKLRFMHLGDRMPIKSYHIRPELKEIVENL